MRILATETRVRYGPVPREIDGQVSRELSGEIPDEDLRLVGDAFLMRTGAGINFLYSKGEGITVERLPGCDLGAEALYLNGSVYAAAACINGFKPIHASAVAHDGKVYAFAGPSGAGKSTLVAALASRGFAMFCDDTLVLDVSTAESVLCLPGHKRLKLTAEAIGLSGAEQEEPVSVLVPKFYARPAAGDVRVPLPLATLIFLEEGPAVSWEPIVGSQRFVRLTDDHYTAHLFSLARRFDRASQFALQARLAQQIPMARLIRPRDTGFFNDTVDLAIRHIIGDEKPGQ